MNPYDLIRLCDGKTVWIQMHNYPDPDAISSAFGLQELLLHFKIEASICYYGTIDKLSSQKLLDLCGIRVRSYEEIRDILTKDDLIILVDCQRGTGNTIELIPNQQAVIDHHPDLHKSYVYSDIRITGSCAGIIASYYEALDITPSEKAASAMLYGLKMDTSQFSRGVTSFDIHMFAYLFDRCDRKLLHTLETNNMEFSDLRAYGAAIENIKVYGNVGFSHVDFKCPDALVAMLSDFLLLVNGIDIVVVYALRDDGCKISVRSGLEEIHAGKLAAEALKGLCNAGGHASMAGGSIPQHLVAEYGHGFQQEIEGRFLRALDHK